jgi:hypothetical protein
MMRSCYRKASAGQLVVESVLFVVIACYFNSEESKCRTLFGSGSWSRVV